MKSARISASVVPSFVGTIILICSPLQRRTIAKPPAKMLPRVLLIVAMLASIAPGLRTKPYQVDTMENVVPWLLKSWNPKKLARPPVCRTKACELTGSMLRFNMNPLEDPCEDFYEYACGGWIAGKEIPRSESNWDNFAQLQLKLNEEIREILEEEKSADDILVVRAAKYSYTICMNTDELERVGVSPIQTKLDELGGWPIIMDTADWDPTKVSWQQIAGNYLRSFAATAFYELYVSPDHRNATVTIIGLDQPSFKVPRSMLTNRNQFPEQIMGYTKFIEDVAMAFAEYKGSKVPRRRIRKDVTNIVNFEIELAKITSPDEMRRDVDRTYNPLTIRQLQKWYDSAQPRTPKGKINWLKIIQNMFSEVNIKISQNDKVDVSEMDYIFKLAALLDKTPPRIIVNYYHWTVVSSLIPLTNKRMRDSYFRMDQVLSGAEEQHPRWRVCVTELELKHAVAYQYVKKYFPYHSKTSMMEMVVELKKKFAAQISNTDWMDERTKLLAKRKLRSMIDFIGFPEWYKNDSYVNHYYKGMKIGSSYFDNAISMMQYLQKKMLRKFRVPVDKNEWPIEATMINAFYNPSANTITFPAAILQTPFFNAAQPDSVNYGGIGAVIGHEISHGFDDRGRQYDGNGNAVQWWSDSTIEAYNERSKCFVDQFNRYTIKELLELNMTIYSNGELTQGENIADTTGLRAAYQVFQARAEKRGEEAPRLPGLEEFNHDQLFFLSFANTWCNTIRTEFLMYLVKQNSHSSSRLRVIGTLSNMESFSRAFGCPAGSPMNPRKKCQLWK